MKIIMENIYVLWVSHNGYTIPKHFFKSMEAATETLDKLKREYDMYDHDFSEEDQFPWFIQKRGLRSTPMPIIVPEKMLMEFREDRNGGLSVNIVKAITPYTHGLPTPTCTVVYGDDNHVSDVYITFEMDVPTEFCRVTYNEIQEKAIQDGSMWKEYFEKESGVLLRHLLFAFRQALILSGFKYISDGIIKSPKSKDIFIYEIHSLEKEMEPEPK